MLRSRWPYPLLIVGLFAAICSAQNQDPKKGVGIPSDWSHTRLVVNNAAAAEDDLTFRRDPRVLSNLAARIATRRPAGVNPGQLAANRSKLRPKPKKQAMKQDWSFALGAGRAAPTMSPAKFNFYTDSSLTAANCASDYVVYALDVPGAVWATIGASGAVRNSNTVTITTSAAHNFTVGYTVTIAGVTDSTFNGTFTIASTPNATTFTYAQAGTDSTSGSGTATMNRGNLVALNNLYSGSLPANNNGLCGSGSGNLQASPTGAVRNANVVTIKTNAAHNLVAGQWVTVTGVTDPSFAGSYQVASVPNATTFTYAQVGPDTASGNGTAAITASPSWAYNTSSATCGSATCAGNGNFTSPAISFDSTGAKVAFVESVSDANATCPGRGGVGACSIFHVLTWAAGEGTIVAPQTPGQGGSTASMVSITYASAANTTSSPWIDYSNDVAYVAADDGNLYRITGVFHGTPTLDSAFTLSVTGSAVRLSPPVQIAGAIPGPANFDVVLIGDANGNVWAVDALNRIVLGTTATPGTPAPIVVGGHTVGSLTPGVLDAPLVYYDPVGDPRHISVFATSSSSANTVHATITNKAAVVQGLVELNAAVPFGTFDDVAGIALGLGATATESINLHQGAFDNTFFTTPTSGFGYFCGTQPPQTYPMLYRIGFNNPLAAPRNNVPVLNSGDVSSKAIVSFTPSAECSPLTEFANPNLAITDILFFGVSAALQQKVFSWDITGALQPGPIVSGGVAEPGGTSAIIVDNTQASSGNGTSQGSSIYFTTLSLSNNCGSNVMCAVKLRQGDLK
ncbi:MAG: hypothetical protein LAN37_07420 [Acidobacteriia bacterium]|nr:hypothetical protein [Terriglobia bacterium]